ncbi:DUF3419 family protein [archaeon]|nr:DUF3419 family protein [archaeon]
MCWEDPKLVTNGLNIKTSDNVLSIASGGENIFAILLKEPNELIALDNNTYQIYLVKLKAIAIKYLEYDEFYCFLGFEKCENRISIFKKLVPYLDKQEIKFWNKNIDLIKKGIINCGKLENYLYYFRKCVLRFVLSKKNIKFYLDLNDIKKQKEFFQKKWNSFTWKILFKIFFSKTLMKLLGRDKKYFVHNKIKNISKHYYLRSKQGITKIPTKTNYFMHMILTGSIPKCFKDHPYLDLKNYKKLKKLVHKIKYFKGTVNDFLTSNSINISKYNLSDIFEKDSQKNYENTLLLISKKSDKGMRICYWNNMVKRSKYSKFIKLKRLNLFSEELFKKDRIFFYSDFFVEEKP